MSFTNDQELEVQATGQADWDSGLNANFQILERGYHVKGTAGTSIVSGQACIVNSANFIVPYDARSLGLTGATLLSYKSVASGEARQFLAIGIVRSMAVWSGFLKIGAPVYVSPASPGFLVSSYVGAAYPVGRALDVNAVLWLPSHVPVSEKTTEAQTLSGLLVGSFGDFTMSLGQRGIVRTLRVVSQSCDAFKVRFWSGSSRVSSELLYETLTRSAAVGSVDVTSLSYLDQAMWPHECTDTTSPGLLFGRVNVQSGSAVNSSHFAVTVVLERFR